MPTGSAIVVTMPRLPAPFESAGRSTAGGGGVLYNLATPSQSPTHPMLRLGNREFAWGGAELGEMRDSNELLGDGDELRARLETDGVRPHHHPTRAHSPHT